MHQMERSYLRDGSVALSVLAPMHYDTLCPDKMHYPCTRSLNSAINKAHVFNFFDRALSNVLSQAASTPSSSTSLPSSANIDLPAPIALNIDKTGSSPSPSPSRKGFGSVRKQQDGSIGGDPVTSATIVKGKRRPRKEVAAEAATGGGGRRPSSVPEAAILKAIAVKKAAELASRTASLTTARQMDSLLDSLLPLSSEGISEASQGSTEASPLAGAEGALEEEAWDIQPSVTPDTSNASFDKFVFGHLDRLGTLVAGSSGTNGAARQPALTPPLSPLDVLGDLEELMKMEEEEEATFLSSEANAPRQDFRGRKGPFLHPVEESHQRDDEVPLGSTRGSGITPEGAGAMANDIIAHPSVDLGSTPVEANNSQDSSKLQLQLLASQLDAAEAESRRLAGLLGVREAELTARSRELAAREEASLEAVGVAGSVLSRLVASEGLGSPDKIFFTQALNRLLSVLMPPLADR